MIKNALTGRSLTSIKIVAIVIMIEIHCRFFFSLYKQFESNLILSPSPFIKFIMLTGLVSLCIPIISGQELFERLRLYIVNEKLVGFKTRPFFFLMIIVSLLDPLKSLFAEGFVYSLRWNALPLICVTMAFVVFTVQRVKLRWLGVPLILSLIVPVFFSDYFASIAIKTPEQYQWFLGSLLYYLSFLAFIGVMSALIFYTLRTFFFFKNQYILLLFVIAINAVVFFHWKSNLAFSVSMFNFFPGVFFHLGEGGGHIWPVFPWSSLVLYGFLFQWLQVKFSRNNQFHFFVIAFSLILILVGFDSFFSNYINLIDARSGYSSKIFGLSSLSFICLFAMYNTLFYLLKLLHFRKLFESYPARIFSSGILIIYITHYILAARLPPIILRHFHGLYTYEIYLLAVYALTLGFSGLLVYLYQSKVKIVFKR